MKKLLIVLLSAVAAATGYSQISWDGDSYVILTINGTGNTYYDVSNQTNDHVNANFAGQTFNITQGQSIEIGGQTQDYVSTFGTTAFLNYAVYSGAPVSSGASFTALNLPYLTTVSGPNDEWDSTAAGGTFAQIGSGLAVGDYTLEVYYDATNGSSTAYDNNSGSPYNYTATIDVASSVPEPSSLCLILCGGLFLARRRRA